MPATMPANTVQEPQLNASAKHRSARELTAILAVFLGAGLIAAAWYTDTHTFVRSVSYVNGVCTSGLGGLAQAMRPSLVAACSQAATLDRTDGYLVIAGVLLVAGGVVVAWRNRPVRRALPAGSDAA